MSRGVLLGAVAVRLATLTETRGQKAGTQIIDAGQTGRQLIASISECLQGNGHGNLYLTDIIDCQTRKQNPSQTLSNFAVNFHDVLPSQNPALTVCRLKPYNWGLS